jgi:hypothetical protein
MDPATKYRAREYDSLGLKPRWLSPEKAKNAYAYANTFSSRERYGLNKLTVVGIESLKIGSLSVATEWLKSRIKAPASVQIIHSESEVCILRVEAFLANWQNLFAPGRDDVVVLHAEESTVLFYCHEDEFEIGIRRLKRGEN